MEESPLIDFIEPNFTTSSIERLKLVSVLLHQNSELECVTD